ncbi:TetR family transcriptional regulator C-terminal domain-containing protein [Pararhizobium sp.]|uniref:TetR family transcriptional regulator C-terminal domain-containing protein n=1 Tax=Pararhizobium sp. TaxID=1977563 RepID=UPI002719F58A|nr:TetR family transcriptional regulator C-terminal domain-containing protein [Pararhizobium sp.]MDO9416256.1 TetR family transcriptional regulator C-terminal domain-containing protein [Pararhizobium sp.]
MSRRPFHRATEAERKRDLIEATLDCIATFGLQGATVRQIAIRAGVTGGLIRHYFITKNLMIEEAYRLTISTMTEKAEAVTGDPQTRLRRFIVVNLTEPVANGRSLSLWASFVSQVRVDPAMAEIHREGYLGFRNALEGLLSDYLDHAGQDASAERCRRLAIAINALLDGLWLEGCLAGELFDVGELIDIALISIERLIDLPLGRE